MNAEHAHENGNYYAAVLEIISLIYLFYGYNGAVGRCYYNVLDIIAGEPAYRIAEKEQEKPCKEE